MGNSRGCPFCNVDNVRELLGRSLALAMLDAFPVNPGHILVVPRRHIPSWFDATDAERTEMLTLLDESRIWVQLRHAPVAFNIGINDGAAAGQTIQHVHIHLIPRYTGDVLDPRGGVRWVLPERADYWSER